MIKIENFESLDGTKLVGTMSFPQSKSKTAVLLAHGLPSNRDEWGFYRDFEAELRKFDIASFRFDFRSNGESEAGRLADLTLGQLVCDLESAFAHFQSQLPSGTAIAVVGTSCGGGVVSRWVAATLRATTRLFLMAPVLDYVFEVAAIKSLFQNPINPGWQAEFRNALRGKAVLNEEIGYGKGMLCDALFFDCVRDLGSVTTPITIFHGTDDSIVPFDVSRDVAERVKNVNLIAIDNADHGFAVAGDDDLTHPNTKANHRFIYSKVIETITHMGK